MPFRVWVRENLELCEGSVMEGAGNFPDVVLARFFRFISVNFCLCFSYDLRECFIGTDVKREDQTVGKKSILELIHGLHDVFGNKFAGIDRMWQRKSV